jgi:urease accessory protein
MPTVLGSLLLADARLPTGSYAHSAGLEPAIVAGLATERVPQYLRARLHTVALVEAAAAVLSHRAAASAEPATKVRSVQTALAARTPSAPLRGASSQLGRGLARLAARRWPQHRAVAALMTLGRDTLRPVAFGVLAGMLGLDEERTAWASVYDDAQTVASAALKLVPVDPADTISWLLDAEEEMRVAVDEAVCVRDVAELPALAAPLIEQYSVDHQRRTRRIFVA